MTVSVQPQAFVQRKRLLVVQCLSAIAFAVLLLTRSFWNEAPAIESAMTYTGVGMILACIYCRLWSILFIGMHKNSRLVTDGPYSITRNPLYLSSTIGVAGIGLVFGSVCLALVFGALSYLVFIQTAHREAAYLRHRFAAEHASYEAGTPAFWPDFRLYHAPEQVMFSPAALRRTFVDGLFFLAAIPLIQAIQWLQEAVHVPVLIVLP